MTVDRYVVVRWTNSGIGDHLSALLAGWWIARESGRSLVVDWRGSRFAVDPGRNTFARWFTLPAEVDGVPIIADERVNDLDLPSPYFWPKWSAQALRAIAHVSHTKEEIAGVKALVSQPHRDEPTIVINQHMALPRDRGSLTPIIEALNFAEDIREVTDSFLTRQLSARRFVGIHIRHGNGENIGRRAAFWLDPFDLAFQLRIDRYTDIHRRNGKSTFSDNTAPSLMAIRPSSRAESNLYRRIAKAIEVTQHSVGEPLGCILFTDAARVGRGLREHLPELVEYDKSMLSDGSGPLHKPEGPHDGSSGTAVHCSADRTREMMIELCMLQQASALVYIPSNFSLLKRTSLNHKLIYEMRPSLMNRLILKLF